jgi:hypothetical protein
LAADPAVRRFLGGSTYRVESVGAWTTAGAQYLEGGIAVLLIQPAANPVDVRIPIAVGGAAGRPNPDPCVVHLDHSAAVTASDVTRADVLVDLNASRVAGITPEPLAADSVSYSDETGPEPSDAYREPEGY